MGEVRVGDRLLGADGHPVAVVAATEVMHGLRSDEVEFSDGEVIVADGQHQWLTWTRAARRYDAQTRGFQWNYAHPVLPQVVTTEQIASTCCAARPLNTGLITQCSWPALFSFLKLISRSRRMPRGRLGQ